MTQKAVLYSLNIALHQVWGWNQWQPAGRAFLSLAWFWHTWKKLCINWVRSLLSMCCLLLGYSLEPRPNSCALGTVNSVTTNDSINECLHLKNQFDERRQDWLIQKFGLWQIHKLYTIQAVPPFLFSTNKKTKAGSDCRVHPWRTEIQNVCVLSTELIITAVHLLLYIHWKGGPDGLVLKNN